MVEASVVGSGQELRFTDRVIATLVILRFQLPHAAVALFYGVDRSTITRAVHEIRPLLAQRGFAVPGKSGPRLRTLADVFAYAAAEGVHLRIDGTEVQVRRPRANRRGAEGGEGGDIGVIGVGRGQAGPASDGVAGFVPYFTVSSYRMAAHHPCSTCRSGSAGLGWRWPVISAGGRVGG